MKTHTLNLICLSLLSLSACGKSRGTEELLGTEKLEGLHGELASSLSAIQDDVNASACDLKLNKIKRHLVSEIVLHMDQATPKESKSAERKSIAFAGSSLIESLTIAPSDGHWENYPESWQSTYQYYRNRSNSQKPEFWVNLNSRIRSLLLDDQNRVRGHVNYSINHSNVAALKNLESVFDSCDSDANCVQPQLSDAQHKAMLEMTIYQPGLDLLDESLDKSQKRQLIHALHAKLTEDADFHHEKINPSIKLSTSNGIRHYSLTLNPGGLGLGEQKTFKDAVEKVWKNSDADFTISFDSSESEANYKLVFDTTRLGERARVSWSKKTLTFFPYTETKALAHEFGHVIGFDDHYYQQWDPKTCSYQSESNGADLMSDHVPGIVTAAEWKLLSESLDKPQS